VADLGDRPGRPEPTAATKLDAQLPDGRKVLLRYYDPRVLGHVVQTMNSEQRAEFVHLIDEWHFIHDGRRVCIGGRRA
jgi:hypothetical protein